MRPSRRAALAGLLVLAALGGAAAEGRFARTPYRLVGTDYAVPHRYAFALALRRGEDWTASVFAIVLTAAAASLVTYRGSLVAREGPAR